MPLSVLKTDGHLFGVLDDVVLGDDETIGIDNETRAGRSDRHRRHAKKSLYQFIKRRGRQSTVSALMLRAALDSGVFLANAVGARSLDGRDMDNCRDYGLHDSGEAR